MFNDLSNPVIIPDMSSPIDGLLLLGLIVTLVWYFKTKNKGDK